MAEFFEIKAPDFLGRNQNFYDQEPYLGISDTRFDIDVTRIFLTRISQYANKLDIALDDQEIFEKTLQESALLLKVPRIKEDALIKGGMRIRDYLGDFPYIWKYTQTQLTRRVYRINGSVQNTKYSEMTPSYPNWASTQQELAGRLTAVILPQEIESPGSVQPQLIAGVSNQETKKWRVFRATEITR